MKKQILAIFISSIILSCGKEGGDNPTPNPNPDPNPIPKPLPPGPTPITSSDFVFPKTFQVTQTPSSGGPSTTVTTTVTRDSSGRIASMSGSDGSSLSVEYDSDGRMKTLHRENDKGQHNVITIEYLNGKPYKLKEDTWGGAFTIIEDYDFNSTGKIQKLSISTKDNDRPNTYTEISTFEYKGASIVKNTFWRHTFPGRNPKTKKSITTYTLDGNGNIVQTVFVETPENGSSFSGNEPTVITDYQYDSNGNFNYNNVVFDPRPTRYLNPEAQLNNITKIMSSTHTPGQGESGKSEENRTYKYGRNAYPSEINKVDSQQTTNTILSF